MRQLIVFLLVIIGILSYSSEAKSTLNNQQFKIDSTRIYLLLESHQVAFQDSMKAMEFRMNKSIKETKNDSWQYIIPIIVAFLAGFLALFQAKANIISRARIDWIENLRKATSEFSGEVIHFRFKIISDALTF